MATPKSNQKFFPGSSNNINTLEVENKLFREQKLRRYNFFFKLRHWAVIFKLVDAQIETKILPMTAWRLHDFAQHDLAKLFMRNSKHFSG